jgi:hypothetical protein
MGEPVTPTPDTTPVNPVQTVIKVLSYVWLAGMAGMLAYTVISYFRVKAKIGTAVRLRDHIFQSESVVSPFVLGLIKPKIYLPFCIDGQDMEYVIAHENAHIRRKDHWWKPVGFLILTLHWFNPLLWLGYVLLCRDIELACDEKVIKELDFQQKADYSQALLNCSVNRRILAACPLAFGEVGVKDRVKSVLNYKKPAFWIIVVAIVASIVTAVCFLTDPVDKKPNPDDVTNQTAERFLKGEISATDKDGRKVSIQDYIRGDYNKYALYDMSGDAVPELIIRTGNGLTIFSIKEQELTVWYEGTVYEKPLNNRAIFYERPGGAPEHTTYQYIVLDHNGEELQRTSFVESYGDNAEYFINGERVSKTDYEDLYKSFDLSDDGIVWKDIPSVDGANPNQEQQSQPAITFRVNSSSSQYTATVNFSNGNTGVAQSVTITDLAAKKDIQTISMSGNELFAENVIYAVDVTFDGNLDILIPHQRPASAAYFQAYVWQESEGKFLYASQFENLPNFVIDQTNGRILSTRTASQITSYSINYYDAEAKDFRPSHAIYWEPDASSNKIHFVEQQYKDGTMVTVKDCLVEKTGNMDVNKSDPQIAECFAPNSFWDLDSQKWKSQFYKPSQNGTTEGTKTAAQAYADFLNGYVTDTSVLYFTKDIDGNGTEELIVDQNTAMEVYTYQGTVKKVGAHDFITGTLLLHHTKDNKYPGIVYVTVGGGKNHFGYITITDGALSVRQTFDDDYGMVFGKKEDVFYTQDENLIAVSRKAYEEFYRIGYSVWEPKTTENPYAIREITDQRVSTVGVKKVFNNGQFTLSVPKSWKCLTASGEDNVVYYFQEPVLGEKCELRINVTFVDYYKERTQEEYLEALSKSRKSVVIDSFTKGSIQGFPCTKIVYSYTENNTEFVGIWYDNLIEGSRLYDFRITYPAAESKNYEKEFAAIIESVRFVANISSLPLEEAYDYALRHYMAGPSSQYRDVGKLQSETQQIVEISGKYYQSFVASNVDIRYIWISQSEFPDNKTALWDWYPVGSSQVYSLDLLGKIDEGRSGNETDKIDPADMLLLSVLYNNQSFYGDRFGEEKMLTISTYQKTISGFTVVDMDSDGKNELAVHLNDGNILLLRQADGIVHGYDFGHRGMNQIYKDGVFSWTEDAGNTYGYSTLRFTDDGVQITELWQVKHDGSGGFTNYIDGKQVSEAQINAIKQQYNWEYVKWFGYGK